MPDAEVDFRTLPLADVLRMFREQGEPADPRPDIDTASLKRRFGSPPRFGGASTTPNKRSAAFFTKLK